MNHKVNIFSHICAAMVVAIHVCGKVPRGSVVWWWERIGHYGVCLMAVPFFFVCSGYFLGRHCDEECWYMRECSKRMRTLLVPFVLWSVIYLGLRVGVIFVANLMHGRDILANVPTGLWFWARAIGLHPYDFPLLVPLWYMRTLLVFVVISPLIVKLIRSFPKGVLFTLWVIAWTGTMLLGGIAAGFFGKFFSLQGLFYFSIGLWIALGHGDRISNYYNKSSGWISLWIGLIFVFVSAGCSFRCGWSSYLTSLIFVPLLLFGFWGVLPKKSLPNFLCGLAFPVYLLHVPVMYVGGLFFTWHAETMMGWWAKYIFALAGSVFVCWVMKRFFPRIASIAFGGRL